MTLARSHLASVSFADSMLFAGGKNETGRYPSIIVNTNDQVDYFLLAGSNGTIVDTNQRLSLPRFDLSGAGLSMLVDQTVYVALILHIHWALQFQQTFTTLSQVQLRFVRGRPRQQQQRTPHHRRMDSCRRQGSRRILH